MILGVVYMRTASDFVEKCVECYFENVARWLGVDKSKYVATPGVVHRDLKEWGTVPLGAEEHSMFRAIVGKVQWIVRVRPDVLYVNLSSALSHHVWPTCLRRSAWSSTSFIRGILVST